MDEWESSLIGWYSYGRQPAAIAMEGSDGIDRRGRGTGILILAGYAAATPHAPKVHP